MHGIHVAKVFADYIQEPQKRNFLMEFTAMNKKRYFLYLTMSI